MGDAGLNLFSDQPGAGASAETTHDDDAGFAERKAATKYKKKAPKVPKTEPGENAVRTAFLYDGRVQLQQWLSKEQAMHMKRIDAIYAGELTRLADMACSANHETADVFIAERHILYTVFQSGVGIIMICSDAGHFIQRRDERMLDGAREVLSGLPNTSDYEVLKKRFMELCEITFETLVAPGSKLQQALDTSEPIMSRRPIEPRELHFISRARIDDYYVPPDTANPHLVRAPLHRKEKRCTIL